MSMRLFRRHEIERREADNGQRFVVCATYGCVVDRDRAKTVKNNAHYDGVQSYCQKCAPPYDQAIYDQAIYGFGFPSVTYYRNVRVTEDGEPFGYVKAPVAKESKR